MNDKTNFSQNEMKMPEEHFGWVQKKDRSSHVAIILGILIIMLMLMLGGLYIWARFQAETPALPIQTNTAQEPANTADQQRPADTPARTRVFETTGTSDEIYVLESDITTSNLESLDSDLTTLDELIMQ